MLPLPRRAFATLLAALVGATALPAATQSFPSKPIRIVVPYAPGATTDIMARLVAQKVSEDLRQPVVVENKAGAAGMIGSDFVAKSAPDGYTLLLGTDGTHVGNPFLVKNPPFHPIRDVTPITLGAKNLLVLLAHPALPVNSVRELIDYAKKNPGKLSFGSSGNGSPHHLAGVLFNQMTGTDILHVAYKGGGPALTDLVGGQIQLAYSSLAAAVPMIKSGKVRALGLTDRQRFAAMPAIPTIAETVPDFAMDSWLAFMGPAGLPPAVTQTLSRSIIRALQAPDVAAKLNEGGLLVVASTPEQFAAQLKADYDKREQLIRKNAITAE